MNRRGFFAALPGVAWLLHRVSRGEVPPVVVPKPTHGWAGTIHDPNQMYGNARWYQVGPMDNTSGVTSTTITSTTNTGILWATPDPAGQGKRWNYTGGR